MNKVALILLVIGFIPHVTSTVTFNAQTNTPNLSTYIPGESVTLTFLITGLSARTSSSINLTIADENGKHILPPTTLSVTSDASGNVNYTYSAPTPRLGYYQAFANLPSYPSAIIPALGTRPAGFITYAVVPDPATRVDYGDLGSRFGLSGDYYSTSVNMIPYLGMRYRQRATTSWSALEPTSPGQFTSQTSSQQMSDLNIFPDPVYKGVTWNTYTFAPLTASALPDWAFIPGTAGTLETTFGALNSQGQSSFPTFVSAMATDFSLAFPNQKRRFYQVTWEPEPTWGYNGTIVQLVQYYSLSYSAIKAADPEAFVVGPTLFIDHQSTQMLTSMWAANFAKYVDGLSIHPYTPAFPPEPPITDLQYEGFIPTLRTQLAAAKTAIGASVSGSKTYDFAFIGTEHGFASVTEGDLQKAQGDTRVAVMMLGEGASFDQSFWEADYWYGNNVENNNGPGFYYNLDAELPWATLTVAPKPSVPAYAAMTYFLDGSDSDGQLNTTTGTQLAYQFTNSHTLISTQVLWDYKETASGYSLPAGVTVCDFMGNCGAKTSASSTVYLGPSPIYVLFSSSGQNSASTSTSQQQTTSSETSTNSSWLFVLCAVFLG